MKRYSTLLRRWWLLIVVAAIPMAMTADAVRIVTTPEEGCFTIMGAVSTDKCVVLTDPNDAQVVGTALDCFVSDVKAVSRKTLLQYKELPAGKNPIIAGTIGQNRYIDQMISDGLLNVDEVKGQWEAYGIQVVDQPMEGVQKALVVFGSQPRGTAYGILELSRLMGVSPWIWWADVTPTTKTQLYVTKGRTIVGSPSVKFRGIFLNDEDFGLRPWAAKNMDKSLNNFGPITYAKIMELLLRLRANTLWPAMHAGSRAFWYEKTNLPLITKYDIYMGSSHCEQMLRDNEYEWGKTGDKFGGHGNQDWVWETNKEMIKRYWAERVGESRGKNAIYTLGMRGVHDTGINGYNSTAEKVTAMTEILAYQRQLLQDSIGDPTTIPQCFQPYKEVLDIYNAGLKVPDDVTLVWVDDNHGYIRQMPTKAEQARSGGNGIYYHLSYWGSPDSYLWLSTISPSLCSYELSKAYHQGIRDQWIINVGDIKPAEEELEFCMDLAWDIQSWTPERAYEYSRYWAAKTFGEDYADDISDIKLQYYQLGIASKPEHVHLCHFDFSDEQIDERIQQYLDIVNRVKELKKRIPTNLRDAYYQLIEYPVYGCADMNTKHLRARQSFLYARAGQGKQALAYASEAQRAFSEIVSMTSKYNTGIASGKWNGMMDYKPNNWSYHLMPAVATSSDVATTECTPQQPHITIIPGGSFDHASATVQCLRGLGIRGTSATVWPLDMKAYSSASQAPYAEYTVPVQKGLNVIQVRCLPTFPLNTSYDLRAGISVNGKSATTVSIKTTAMSATWDETVAQGYFTAPVHYTSTEDGEVSVRVYFMDPGLTVSAIASVPFEAGLEDLTNTLLTNADFEYTTTGALNPQGTTSRGYPRGWRATGTLSGNSWGINQDAKHIYGINCFWASASPMPNTYEFSQTIASSKIEPGTYLVTCNLGVFKDKLANCRLFANKVVQYYGTSSDYTSAMLTAGESATYAGYGASGSGRMRLNPMQVIVTVGEGESLKVGIRSSNYKSDGSRSTNDNHGWFKVDHFRIQRIDPEFVDAIRSVKEETPATTSTDAIYDLSGRRISCTGSLPKGIYIQGGRKMVW